MAEEVKFSEDEMKEVGVLQQTYVNVQNSLGQVGVQKLRVEQQLFDLNTAEDKLKTQFVETQTKEREFVDSINKKYGDGNLDLNSGVFTPAPPAAETPVVGAPSAASAVKPDKTL